MKTTQAQRLYAALRRRGYTYLELLQLGVSTSPWRRLSESPHHLKPGERLERKKNAQGLTVLRVTRA